MEVCIRKWTQWLSEGVEGDRLLDEILVSSIVNVKVLGVNLVRAAGKIQLNLI